MTFGYFVDILHFAFDAEEGSVDTLTHSEREMVAFGLMPSMTRKLGQRAMDLIASYQGKPFWTKGITMCSRSEYEWVMSGPLMQQMRACHRGQHFYSNNFDANNWCLFLSPMGWTQHNHGLFSFQLKLLRKPYRVAALYVLYKLETDFCGLKVQKAQIFHFQNCRSGWSFDEHKVPFERFKDLDALTIKVELEILGAYDVFTRKAIPRKDWSKYGILEM